ncbi:MAG: ribonuclease P protein component [Fibrobacter sp.]|nr:ribonuclease P protein component [Fibrobacter sp.]MCQ2121441.1 ribonuclease P protein component [Fibrobacter sp.]
MAIATLRSYRLPTQPAYRQVTIQGKYVRASSLAMRWIESPDGFCRFCFVARKKNGNAVYRNKCRRVLRPLFFSQVPEIKKPVWAMVFVNDDSKEMTPERLRESALKLFRKMEWRSDVGEA